MCDQCDGFAKRRVNTPYEYRDLLTQVQARLATGQLIQKEGLSASEILSSGEWMDDVVSQLFACTACGRKFHLAVDVYHGSGGAWDVEG